MESKTNVIVTAVLLLTFLQLIHFTTDLGENAIWCVFFIILSMIIGGITGTKLGNMYVAEVEKRTRQPKGR